MLERRSAPQTLSWFLDLHHSLQLDLNPPYQRLSVWNDNYRKYFIDTILKNYPSPAIFLDVEITNVGQTIYHVVDGKQRLSSIIDFVNDVFPTAAKFSGSEGAKYFSDLSDEQRNRFFRYVVPVEFLERATESELEQAFDRLNRNVSKLNAQELRNAKYSGAFISLMEALADDPFWTTVGLATKARIRRMLDIEFVSELFALTMRGVQEGKSVLDDVYSEYDEEILDIDFIRPKYENCKNELEKIWPYVETDRFKNLADFYSLWAALLEVIQEDKVIDYEQTARSISEFADSVRSDESSPEANRYLVAATQGSSKAANRKTRADILKSKFVFK